MPQYRVYFTRITEIAVTVVADDQDEAVDAAYDEIPPLPAIATGWGQTWIRDESGEPEPESVFDETAGGVEVWNSGERWTRVPDGARTT